jgi:hypothetical protein
MLSSHKPGIVELLRRTNSSDPVTSERGFG